MSLIWTDFEDKLEEFGRLTSFQADFEDKRKEFGRLSSFRADFEDKRGVRRAEGGESY